MRRYEIGDHVRKIKGSKWHGVVCGFYSTELTPIGYCVESEFERGSVQIYPENALEPAGNNRTDRLERAARAVEQWWITDGMNQFDGAPAAIFALREALK